jgi:hypothetical protein
MRLAAAKWDEAARSVARKVLMNSGERRLFSSDPHL